MKEYHKNILRKHYVNLLEEFEPKPVIRYLHQTKIIDEDDFEEISSRKTRQDMNEALLSTLMRGLPEAFIEFVKGLQGKQPGLAGMLLQEGE